MTYDKSILGPVERALLVMAVALTVGCARKPVDPAPPTAARYDAVARLDFNRLAVRENLPVYWIADTNDNRNLDPDEVASLLFYPTQPRWVEDGRFTPAFEAAYAAILKAAQAPAVTPTDAESRRRALVIEDLDQGRPTLLATDFSALPAADRKFVGHMLKVADLVDELYERQNGAATLAASVAADAASQSLFRRNRGPKCAAPSTKNNPECTAIPGAPKVRPDVYPAELQDDPKFCEFLAGHPRSRELLNPFVAVRGSREALVAVPYPAAYPAETQAIAAELNAAATAIDSPREAMLAAYLRAAAQGFTTNDWVPADEAWARMGGSNSAWYVRVAPDETYWDPCARKAGVHLSFARINAAALEWQRKLIPVQQQMEAAVAARAGVPYRERKVSFKLPDFIDIVINAGDDRGPFGATIGQSLPNWGPVATEGRGRTVVMTNLSKDPDSQRSRRARAQSILVPDTLAQLAESTVPELLSNILHEATHNLGPSHEYQVGGRTDDEVFGGQLAAVIEETKAQSGALFLIEFLRARGIISDELARQTYVDTVVWGFGHIAEGMYEPDGTRNTYSQVSAIQNGILIEQGALTWDPQAPAANGQDRGAFRIDPGRMPAASDALMTLIGGIKARGDKPQAEALLKRFVDSDATIPHAVVQERYRREPRGSFVYAVTY